MSKETFDQKLERFEKDREESNKRINKLLAERDLTRETRYQDKRNELLRDLCLEKYHLEKLESQAAPIRKRVAALQEQIKKLDRDHENNLDHCFMYSDLQNSSAEKREA